MHPEYIAEQVIENRGRKVPVFINDVLLDKENHVSTTVLTLLDTSKDVKLLYGVSWFRKRKVYAFPSNASVIAEAKRFFTKVKIVEKEEEMPIELLSPSAIVALGIGQLGPQKALNEHLALEQGQQVKAGDFLPDVQVGGGNLFAYGLKIVPVGAPHYVDIMENIPRNDNSPGHSFTTSRKLCPIGEIGLQAGDSLEYIIKQAYSQSGDGTKYWKYRVVLLKKGNDYFLYKGE